MPSYNVTIKEKVTNKAIITNYQVIARDDIMAGIKAFKDNEDKFDSPLENYTAFVSFTTTTKPEEKKEVSYDGDVIGKQIETEKPKE